MSKFRCCECGLSQPRAKLEVSTVADDLCKDCAEQLRSWARGWFDLIVAEADDTGTPSIALLLLALKLLTYHHELQTDGDEPRTYTVDVGSEPDRTLN